MRGGDRFSKRARGCARELEARILRFYLVRKTFAEIAPLVGMSVRGVQNSYARAHRWRRHYMRTCAACPRY